MINQAWLSYKRRLLIRGFNFRIYWLRLRDFHSYTKFLLNINFENFVWFFSRCPFLYPNPFWYHFRSILKNWKEIQWKLKCKKDIHNVCLSVNYVLKWYPSHSCKNCKSCDKKSQGCPFLYLLFYAISIFYLLSLKYAKLKQQISGKQEGKISRMYLNKYIEHKCMVVW